MGSLNSVVGEKSYGLFGSVPGVDGHGMLYGDQFNVGTNGNLEEYAVGGATTGYYLDGAAARILHSGVGPQSRVWTFDASATKGGYRFHDDNGASVDTSVALATGSTGFRRLYSRRPSISTTYGTYYSELMYWDQDLFADTGVIRADQATRYSSTLTTPPTADSNDDFGGGGNNSGTIGDANYNARWQDSTTVGYPPRSITGGKLTAQLDHNANTQQVSSELAFQRPWYGDFAVKVDLTTSNLNNPTAVPPVPPNPVLTPYTSPSGILIVGYISPTGTTGNLIIGWVNADFQPGATDWAYIRYGATAYANFATGVGTKTLEISRVGTTLSFKDGGTTFWSGTMPKYLSPNRIRLANSNGSGSTTRRYGCDFAWDNFKLNDNANGDGTGNAIPLKWTL
jgi:hypothetical protein